MSEEQPQPEQPKEPLQKLERKPRKKREPDRDRDKEIKDALDRRAERPYRPQLVNPVSDEELADMKTKIATTDQGIFAAFDDQQSTIPGVVGGMLGLQNKDWLSILERTNIPDSQMNTVIDMIRIAEHGVGGEVLDIPIPYVGKQVVNYLRARISITNEKGHGMSRDEVVEVLTNWAAKLEAREAEQKRQKTGVAG